MSTPLKFAPDTIETVAITDLRPYERNPRLHSPEQVAKIAASMMEFGWTIPILINDENEIIAGHGRIMAAEHLSIDTVPAIRIKHLSDAQVKALRIADNQTVIAGEWDNDLLSFEVHDLNSLGFDLDTLGFDVDALAVLLQPLSDEDSSDGDEQASSTLAERFGIPPFSVLNAREGWWQDRKRAWVALGIQSELGRGQDRLEMAHPATTSTIDFYAQKRALETEMGKDLTTPEARQILAERGTITDARAVNAARKAANAIPGGGH